MGWCMGRGLGGFFVVSLCNDDLKLFSGWVGFGLGLGVVVGAAVGLGFAFAAMPPAFFLNKAPWAYPFPLYVYSSSIGVCFFVMPAVTAAHGFSYGKSPWRGLGCGSGRFSGESVLRVK